MAGLRVTVLSVFLSAVVLSCLFHQHSLIHIFLPASHTATTLIDTPASPVASFWKELTYAFEYAHPLSRSVGSKEGTAAMKTNNDLELNRHEPSPSSIQDYDPLNITHTDEAYISRAHYRMKSLARHLGNKVPFSPNTTGIVTTLGTHDLADALISLRMLRRTGCQLPVELFLSSSSKSDATVCEELPSLNAHCRVLSDIYGSASDAGSQNMNELKAFAVLFSSFQMILYLDANTTAIQDPSSLFDTIPFTSHAMVTWSSMSKNTWSTHYQRIAGLSKDTTKPLQATDVGQMMLDKAKLGEGLIMAAYYNYYGTDFYYPLLRTNTIEEGYIETFVAAATAMNADFYQAINNVRVIKDVGSHEAVVFQADPRMNYERETTNPVQSHMVVQEFSGGELDRRSKQQASFREEQEKVHAEYVFMRLNLDRSNSQGLSNKFYVDKEQLKSCQNFVDEECQRDNKGLCSGLRTYCEAVHKSKELTKLEHFC